LQTNWQISYTFLNKLFPTYHLQNLMQSNDASTTIEVWLIVIINRKNYYHYVYSYNLILEINM